MSRATPAEKLLEELGVTEPSEIDIEAIAWHCGARIDYRPLKRCEAQIIGYGDKAIIVVNQDSHSKRKRFSIAHELGHWHHHRGHSSICRSADIENYSEENRSNQAFALERVADKYAADLLLPIYLFQPRAEALGKVSIATASHLANEFDTSLTAALMRLVDMNSDLSMLVCYGHDGRKWFKRGCSVPESWFPKKELDPSSGAVDVLFGEETKSCRRLVKATIWFDGRDARGIDVFQEIIRVSRLEILALLVFKDQRLPGN